MQIRLSEVAHPMIGKIVMSSRINDQCEGQGQPQKESFKVHKALQYGKCFLEWYRHTGVVISKRFTSETPNTKIVKTAFCLKNKAE